MTTITITTEDDIEAWKEMASDQYLARCPQLSTDEADRHAADLWASVLAANGGDVQEALTTSPETRADDDMDDWS